MIRDPRPGQVVRIRYKGGHHPSRPLHDALGTVVVVSRGRPRNHGVLVGDRLYVVPCGHLMGNP